MRRFVIAPWLVCVLLTPAWGYNLVVNGGFEDGSTGWAEWRADWGSQEQWDYTNTEPGHLDSACLKLGQLGTVSSFGVFQEVQVVPGQAYTVDALWKGLYHGEGNRYEILLIDGAFDVAAITHPTTALDNLMYGYYQWTNPLPPEGFGWIYAHDQNDSAVDYNDRNGVRVATGTVMTVVLKAEASSGAVEASLWFDDIALTPEPATLAMLIPGLLWLRRRR